MRLIFKYYFLVFLFSGHLLEAQKLRTCFNFNGGAGIPVSNFGSNNMSDAKAGGAKAGFYYGFDLYLGLKTNPWGFSAAFRNIQNPIDVESASKNISNAFPGVPYAASSTPWRSRSFLIGVYANLAFDSMHKFAVTPRFQAGWMSLTPYHLDIALPAGYNGAYSNPVIAAQKGFAFMFSLSFRYELFRAFYISLNGDYLHADVEFEKQTTTPSNAPTYFSQPVDVVNVSLGIGIKW